MDDCTSNDKAATMFMLVTLCTYPVTSFMYKTSMTNKKTYFKSCFSSITDTNNQAIIWYSLLLVVSVWICYHSANEPGWKYLHINDYIDIPARIYDQYRTAFMSISCDVILEVTTRYFNDTIGWTNYKCFVCLTFRWVWTSKY